MDQIVQFQEENTSSNVTRKHQINILDVFKANSKDTIIVLSEMVQVS